MAVLLTAILYLLLKTRERAADARWIGCGGLLGLIDSLPSRSACG